MKAFPFVPVISGAKYQKLHSRIALLPPGEEKKTQPESSLEHKMNMFFSVGFFWCPRFLQHAGSERKNRERPAGVTLNQSVSLRLPSHALTDFNMQLTSTQQQKGTAEDVQQLQNMAIFLLIT